MIPGFLSLDAVGSSHSTTRELWRIRLIITLSLASPIILLAFFSYLRADRDLTNLTLSRRESVAYLGASMLAEKLDRLVDIGTSLATRVQFRRLIAKGRWSEAIDILASVPKDFPFIDRVFLADPAGTLTADIPALPGVRGKNFSFRDWYQGVSRRWEPYVSDVYKRAAPPQYNVVAVAIPIRSETEAIIGILVLQVRLETLTEWTKHIGLGPTGFVYVVDRKGNIAVHPKFSPEGNLADFSRVPTVQRVLRGERGVEILFNPVENEKSVAAYAPVPRYGWGLVAVEETQTAFQLRNKGLTFLLAVFTMMFLLSCSLSYLVIRAFAERRRSEGEIKKLNEDLRHRATELETANKELEAFSYSVSHDLRAPLRHIDGYVEFLRKHLATGLDMKGQRYMDTIADSARQMGRLVDDLLMFSRMGRAEMNVSGVSMQRLVDEALNGLRSQMTGRDIDWKIGNLPEVQGDPVMLRQVWLNLIDNAVKYTRTRERAEIEIGSVFNGDESMFFVRDNGVGFDPQYAGKLFGVFERLHRSDEFEGTGIGLANVRRIILRHGGRTWAEGQVEAGATFYFSVPKVKGGRA